MCICYNMGEGTLQPKQSPCLNAKEKSIRQRPPSSLNTEPLKANQTV